MSEMVAGHLIVLLRNKYDHYFEKIKRAIRKN